MAKPNKLPSDLKAIPAGDDLMVNCIVPSHPDKEASLHITRAENGRILWHCFGGCPKEVVGDELRRLGFLDDQVKPPFGLTLSEYAAAKQLPAQFLRKHGVVNDSYFDKDAIKIPYGPEGPIRYRTSLTDGPGRKRFWWEKGSKIKLYGLWHLGNPEYVILVEGESDAQTLWLHEYPAQAIGKTIETRRT